MRKVVACHPIDKTVSETGGAVELRFVNSITG